ncbi:hypothetical protein SPRG_03054 [Saprolegnia parasitica CBS 223.65]|uniref:Uncharacterized protein n=1 Tax=Saprolegnia parasitica (strain CBS 223.65) TaxID=695850 RepID=A0A067CTK8_SAPPC|nr:hypothetical protein SPRG_03054 [Saprolegnia parasitica CBS 223.65]KDO32580.1 hypothetical protein SPRG_03054 [Saprolegnia parasitica CBS 223.65]|eukprot:XP_012197025.1 hypothetical protein SPRG_03054 [Saprolegnia parasitica CBS 223.65]
MTTRGWVCHLCTKMNPVTHDGPCLCCGRPRRHAVKSLAKKATTKALLLHADLSKHTRPEQVADMVEHGFDVNELSSEGYTVLHCAARHGQAGIVRELLRFGADTEIEATGGRRALHYAVESGSMETVQELVSRGALPSPATNGDALTPLHIAGQMGHHKIADVLLRAGARLGAVTKHMRQTALHLAAEAGHIECVRVFMRYDLEGDVVGAVDASGATATQTAQFAQRSVVVELLQLQIGAGAKDRLLDRLLAMGAGRPSDR